MNRQDFIKSNNKLDYVTYVSYLEFEKKQLIKYLEDESKYYSNLDSVNCNIRSDVYKDLLEKVRSGEYE